MEMLFDLSKKHKLVLPTEVRNLVFEPYSQKEIYSIINIRLSEMRIKLGLEENCTMIDDRALRLCAGRMYNLKGGDIRCLFDVCKKALEQQQQAATETGEE